MCNIFKIFLIATYGGSFLAYAAESPSGGGPRTCRILFLSAPDNAPKKIFLSDGASVQQVELPSLNLSDIYPLVGGDVTLRMLTQPPVEGQPIPEQAPKINVPEAVKDFYLLVASDLNPVAPLRMQVIDANPSSFRASQMLWFNLTPFTVGGQLGKNSFTMKPNSRFIADPPAEGREDYLVKFGYSPGEINQLS